MSKAVGYLLICLLLIGAASCVALGRWQWHRGELKEQILARVTAQDADPLGWRQLDDSANNGYRRFRLSGRYLDERQFLLINRVHRRQAGYEVLTPFRLAGSGQSALVDRGWIAARALAQLEGLGPAFPGLANVAQADAGISREEQRLLGEIFPKQAQADSIRISGIGVPFVKGFRLGHNRASEPYAIGDRLLDPILYRDEEDIAQRLGSPLAPLMLVLDPAQPGSLEYALKPESMTPGRHYAYAVQWFVFSAVQLFAAVFFWRRRQRSLPSDK